MFGLSCTLIPRESLRSPRGQSSAIVIVQSTTNGRTRKRAHGTREMSARDIDRDLTRGSMRAHVHIGEEEVRFTRAKVTSIRERVVWCGFVGWNRIFSCRLVVVFTNVVSFNEARFKYEEKEGNLWTDRES